jgi:hypothetical protein
MKPRPIKPSTSEPKVTDRTDQVGDAARGMTDAVRDAFAVGAVVLDVEQERGEPVQRVGQQPERGEIEQRLAERRLVQVGEGAFRPVVLPAADQRQVADQDVDEPARGIAETNQPAEFLGLVDHARSS